MNKTATCRNCDVKNQHSSPFCPKARSADLQCQLCLGIHNESNCAGPGHVSLRRWKALVRDPFLGLIGGGGSGGGYLKKKVGIAGAATIDK
eukprot:3552169-Rhodomonas_salina.1